ncbi:MAG TPA: GAF domain-containing protein [Phototrophicaceae bacterium]|nr:GAF domain-containing protein [Phototrophicaceae bacterium]
MNEEIKVTDSNDANIYHNVVTGATPDSFMPDPDEIDEQFAQAANQVLKDSVELARLLIGAHQGALAIVIHNDWKLVRKYFSLSGKYAAWADYQTPAVGYGIHNWILGQKQILRLTQVELEAHPEWKGFGKEAGTHPPMRGWLVAPMIDKQGTNWGLFQLSDKYEGDFTQQDEDHFARLVDLVSTTLEALWQVRNLRKQQMQTGLS